MSFERSKDLLRRGRESITKPRSWQLLAASGAVGFAVAEVLDRFDIDIANINPLENSDALVLGALASGGASALNYLVSGQGGGISRADTAERRRCMMDEGTKLKGITEMLWEQSQLDSSDSEESLSSTAENEMQRLKYTYLAMVRVADYMMTNKKGDCMKSLATVCSGFSKGTDTCNEEEDKFADPKLYYRNIFRTALIELRDREMGGCADINNTSFLLELVNHLKHKYDQTFVRFVNDLGESVDIEKAASISDRTSVAENELLQHLNHKARSNRGMLYLLLALSAASMVRPEDLNAFMSVSDSFVRPILDMLSSQANLIIGTSAAYFGGRAMAITNSSNIIARFFAHRYEPHERRARM